MSKKKERREKNDINECRQEIGVKGRGKTVRNYYKKY